MKKSTLFAALVLVIITITACSYLSSPVDEKVLMVALGGDPLHFNPNINDISWGIYPVSNIMNCLVARDEKNNYVMDLAETSSMTEDGKQITFYLNDNVKWHDGEKFTSADVKWTFEAVINRKGLFVERLKYIDEVFCPDEYTVVFKLKQPVASFMSIVSSVYILPKHIYEGTDWIKNAANHHPIGTGPYEFYEYKNGVSVVLKANNDYFKGKPEIQKIVYSIIADGNNAVQAFMDKDIDILDRSAVIPPSSIAAMEADPSARIIKSVTTSRQYIAFNMKKYPMNMLAVRRAIAYAVDRDDIIERAFKGYGIKAEGFYTPSISWAYNDKTLLPKRDIQKAMKLLEKSGYHPDKDGVRLKNLELIAFQSPAFLDTAKIVQANLKELDIDVNITVLDYSAWLKRVQEGEYDMTILSGDFGCDPDDMSLRFSTKGFMNIMGYKNQRVDSLLEEGNRIFKEDERAVIYKEVQKILSEDLPIIPISEHMNVTIMRNYISGHPAEEGIGKIPSTQYSLISIDKKENQ